MHSESKTQAAATLLEKNSTGSFPVVFFYGEREADIGNINVYPSLEFKQFQLVVSQKIGIIAPHLISVSLITRRNGTIIGTRKFPITEKIKFGVVAFERGSYFLAVLKRSRRERRGGAGGGGKPRQINLEEEIYSSSSQIDIPLMKFSISPPEKMLLRRNPPGAMNDSSQFGLISSYYGQITSPESLYKGLGFLVYENQLRIFQIQKENYLMSTNPYPYTELEDEYLYGNNINDRDRSSSMMMMLMPKSVVVCEECSGSKGRPIPFHWCVYDTITVGFRSPAGPIARPSSKDRRDPWMGRWFYWARVTFLEGVCKVLLAARWKLVIVVHSRVSNGLRVSGSITVFFTAITWLSFILLYPSVLVQSMASYSHLKAFKSSPHSKERDRDLPPSDFRSSGSQLLFVDCDEDINFSGTLQGDSVAGKDKGKETQAVLVQHKVAVSIAAVKPGFRMVGPISKALDDEDLVFVRHHQSWVIKGGLNPIVTKRDVGSIQVPRNK